jgi:hypothetical protein
MSKLTDVDVARFWAKVERSEGCWEWTAATSHGYGILAVKHRSRSPMRAHRVSWEIHNGPIPGNMHVLHTCDNRRCVRIEHLFLGTNADNTADRVAKGRTRTWATERRRLGSSHPRSKLTEDIVRESRALWRSGSETSVSLAARHGVAQATMHAALTGQTWRHVH